ncbi:MAG TPA: hypothetical protein VD908_18410 [Cytophagales bacterium]|nr:hypothetical protein [Cytophagales bacterium]
MKKIKPLVATVAIFIVLLGCNKEEIEAPTPPINSKLDSVITAIKGYAQKGPFIVGSDVTISELDTNLSPTGRNFYSTIISDVGYFELPSIKLASKYVQIKVEGKYFNEVQNYVSLNRLTLYTLVDVTKGNDINVNFLTDIQKRRVEKLVGEGLSFDKAKTQSLKELLQIFSINTPESGDPEYWNIAQGNAGDGILLAISCILSNFVNEWGDEYYADWLAFLIDLKLDYSEDGILNSKLIQDKLLTNASALDTAQITSILIEKYKKENKEISIPPFSTYLKDFIENSPYQNYLKGILPKKINDTINILTLNDSTQLNSNSSYAIYIEAPIGVEYGVGVSLFVYPESLGNIECKSSYWESASAESYSLHVSKENTIKIPIKLSGTGKMRVNVSMGVLGAQKFNTINLFW